MSRVLDAECRSNVVKQNGVEVPSAQILSEGNGQSSGVLLIDGSKAVYLTSSAQDLKETLERIIEALQSVSSALSSLDGAGYYRDPGPSPSPPLASGAISSLNSAISGLEEFKEVLK